MTTTPPEPNDAHPNPGPDAPQQPIAPQPDAAPQQPGEQQAPAYTTPVPGYSAAPPAPGLPPYQAPAPSSGSNNVLAIVAFITSFFVSIVGIICGHIALSQIKRTGEKGRGFALAGLIIGYVSIAATIVSVVVVIIASVAGGLAVASAARTLPTELPTYSSGDTALVADCALLSTAAARLVPVLNEQIPNLATDPIAAQAEIVAAFDSFAASTSILGDVDLSSEVDAFNAEAATLKADMDAYIATPEAERDSTLLESDVNVISDQFDTLASYCG